MALMALATAGSGFGAWWAIRENSRQQVEIQDLRGKVIESTEIVKTGVSICREMSDLSTTNMTNLKSLILEFQAKSENDQQEIRQLLEAISRVGKKDVAGKIEKPSLLPSGMERK